MTTTAPPQATSTTDVPYHPMWIDGAPVDSHERFEIRSPATEELVATVAKGDASHVDAAVAAAKASFESGVWRDKTPAERAAVLDAVAAQLDARNEELAQLQAMENGAPLRVARWVHIGLPAEQFRYFAELARTYQWVKPAPALAGMSTGGMVRQEPVGVCAAIVPWNVPLQLAVNKVGPALAAGNSVVIKPDEQAPLTVLELAAELERAGLPAGVFNVVTGVGEVVGARLAEHPDVRKIAFTGSTAVGREVMSRASGTVKRVTLELGGKGPNIVLDDISEADMARVVDGCLFAFLTFSGQGRESGTRLLLPAALHDDFVERMVRRVADLRIGHPMADDTDLGPVFSRTQRDRILGYIASGLEEGATLACGGKSPEGPQFEQGFWVEPTIFTGVTNDMRIAREEIFGPVVAVIKYETLDEAIAIANDTIYGLSGGVWSSNIDRAVSVAEKIDAGMVWINDFHVLDSRYPFGGMKQSGLGRELGPDALDEYTEAKQVTYALGRREDEKPYALLFGIDL